MQGDYRALVVISVLLIFVAIICVLFIVERKKSKTQEQVVLTSKRYAFLLKQKELIQSETLNELYKITRYMNSTAQLNRLNLFNQMVNIIQGDPSLQDTIDRCQQNAILSLSFLHNMKNAPGFSSKEKGVSRMYLKIEQKLCNELHNSINPIVPSFLIHFEYTSPKGRNTWYKNFNFTTDDMVEYKKICKTIEKNKETAKYQRSLMTSTLRYDVMKRDGFRCVLCGRGAFDGVKLHVDHIVPIAKGGKTVMSNLRTLCEECNLGKKDKYDQLGIN